jgi:uncharacterized protein (DUF885 family)
MRKLTKDSAFTTKNVLISTFKSIAFLVVTLLLMNGCAQADDNEDLHALFNQHWQQAKEEKIFFRTEPGAWKPNGKLADFSAQGIAKRRAFNAQVLKQLSTIDSVKLSDDNLMSYRLFKYEREFEQKYYHYQDQYFPINFLSGWHTYFAEAPANMAFLNSKDYENFLISLADYPRFNRENIDLMKRGVSAGFVHACDSFRNYAQSIQQHIVNDAENSALFEPFRRFPTTFTSQQKQNYRTQAKQLINPHVVPSYQEILDFFTQQYMPNCRQKAGIGSFEGVQEFYAYAIEYYTTTKLSAQKTHNLGLSEVARIKKEMLAIIKQASWP